MGVHALDIALDRLGTLRHGAVDPGRDRDRPTARGIPPEARRDLDGEADLTGAHAPVEVGIVADWRLLGEVARAGEVQRIVLADRCLILIEHREGQVLDIHVDAVADDEHQDHAADQGERGADRVPAEFERLALRIAEHAPKIEGARGRRGRGVRRRYRQRGRGGRWIRCREGGFVDRILEIGDEGLFEIGAAAPRDDAGRRIADQHLARMHQRDAVAALGLVHEMRRDEDRHAVLPRQVDEDLPERVARDRVDAGGRLVEDQHLRRVDHRHREREPLPHAERESIGQHVHDLGKIETLCHLGDAAGNGLRRHLEQPGVQVEVLPDGELGIEREGLRHVADAPARLDIAGIDLPAEQPGAALARFEQAGQHLHRRGLATAVRAEEAEDFPARNRQIDRVDSDEIAEAHGQPLGFDRQHIVMAGIAGRDHHGVVVGCSFLPAAAR
jgi:hypothetical protein